MITGAVLQGRAAQEQIVTNIKATRVLELLERVTNRPDTRKRRCRPVLLLLSLLPQLLGLKRY
ncbi:hypothetical protein GCM10009716_05850 [Streptomyces sodiiphilus]|uniref:Uncharacterized protein n=1 Tax=Streptomyces sodiiphilus TaxID=226217 RepID=A0ABP5A1I6_9ACTN